MSSDHTTKVNQTPWSLAALIAAALAIFGLGPSSSSINSPSGPSPKESSSSVPMPTGLVSFPTRTWDDPFTQVTQARKLLSEIKGKQSNSNGKIESLQEILLQRVFETSDIESIKKSTSPETKLLVNLNLLPGKMTNSDINDRLDARHVQEIAFSLYGFRPVLPERLSFVLLQNVETYFSAGHRVTSSPAVPIKLYENKSTKQFILNVWIDQASLGTRPWQCLKSVVDSLFEGGKFSEQIKECLMPCSDLAILGPSTSDILAGMAPEVMSEDGKFFLGASNFIPPERDAKGQLRKGNYSTTLSRWKTIYWQINRCSVPLQYQWPELFKSPAKIDEAKIRDSKYIPMHMHVSIPDDLELIRVLADELETRLGDFAGCSRQILLFVEQDRTYGRFLGEQLKSQLLESSPFQFITIPYIREIGEPTSDEKRMNEPSTASVSDYFQRTLDGLGGANSSLEKPAAIGVLGGTWEDKFALLRDIRARFPQSLCFTNDYNCRYFDKSVLPITRNLIIASHGNPMPKITSAQGDIASIAFRTEYQSTDLVGFSDLFEKAFHFQQRDQENAGTVADAKRLSPNVEPRGKTEARVYEVSNAGGVGMPLRSEESTLAYPLRPLLAPVFGCLSVALLTLFPLLDYFVAPKLTGTLKKTTQPYISNRLFNNFEWLTNAVMKNLFSSAAVLAIALLCLFPTATLQEFRSARFVHWGLGVSVIPSILLLALTIPYSFRMSIKWDPARRQGSSNESSKESTPRASNRDYQLAQFEKVVLEMGLALPNRKEPEYEGDSGKGMESKERFEGYGIVYSFVIITCGCFAWYWSNDTWIFLIGLLGALAYMQKIKPTMSNAVMITMSIGIAIGFARYIASDYEQVPARDLWLRIAGSTCFVVAYWWLILGLVKLVLYQNRLRRNLRIARRWMEESQIHTVSTIQDGPVANESGSNKISIPAAEAIDRAIFEAGRVSKSISQDLSLLAVLGLVVCIARIPLIDSWGMSEATWLTIILPMVLPFVFAIILRRQAWRFRESAIQYLLRAKLIVEEGGDQEREQRKLKEIQSLIKSFDVGVFAPIDRDPLVSAGAAITVAFISGPNSEILKRIMSIFIL